MPNKVKFQDEVKMGLKAIFATEVLELKTYLRTHVKEIGTDQFKALAMLINETDNNISIKRSGIGITILVH